MTKRVRNRVVLIALLLIGLLAGVLLVMPEPSTRRVPEDRSEKAAALPMAPVVRGPDLLLPPAETPGEGASEENPPPDAENSGEAASNGEEPASAPPAPSCAEAPQEPGQPETGFDAVVRGVVTDAWGVPVAGASVRLVARSEEPNCKLTAFEDGEGWSNLRPRSSALATTNKHGEFRFVVCDFLELASPWTIVTCDLVASGTGVPGSDKCSVTLVNGDEKLVDLQLGGFGTVSGRVVGPDGLPLANVSVSIFKIQYTTRYTDGDELRKDSAFQVQDFTDDDGEFFLEGAPTGGCQILAMACGLRMEEFPVECFVALGLNTDIGDLRMVQAPAVRLSIAADKNLKARLASPVTWKIVELLDARGEVVHEARLQASTDGTWYASNLPVGSWKAKIRIKGFQPVTIEIDVSASSVAELGEIVLEPHDMDGGKN